MSKVEFALRVKQALHDLPPEIKKLLDELDVPNAPTPQPTKDEDGRDEVEWHTGRFLCTQSRGLTAALHYTASMTMRAAVESPSSLTSSHLSQVPEEAIERSREHLQVMATIVHHRIADLWDDPAAEGVEPPLIGGVL